MTFDDHLASRITAVPLQIEVGKLRRKVLEWKAVAMMGWLFFVIITAVRFAIIVAVIASLTAGGWCR